MSDNKFIERLKGKDTSKSILEINNEAAKTSFANMPSGTSNAIDVYSDHRADATAVLNGTINWKISNNDLILANDVAGDGADFSSTYSVSGAGLWIDSVYTFPSTGDPAHPVAMVFNPSTKWVLKVCGDNLIVDGGYIADFTLLVKIGTSNVFTKTFSVAEQAGQFCKEFVLDFEETNAGIIKASGLTTLTVQLLCGTANASARIYNGMTVLTCLQRKVDASAVSTSFANVEEALQDGMLPSDYFNNAAFIDQVEDGEQAYAVFERDGDTINLAGWTPKDAVAYKDEVIIKAEVMPTPNTDLVGAIYQYTGVTAAPYEHGYIYECKETSPGVYGWERIDVQPGGSRGRFLALWNCATGLAESNPPISPYEYKTGDYFIVGAVSSATPAINYKPDGTSYIINQASITVETNEVAVDDTYFFDGTTWRLQSNSNKTVTYSNIAGDIYDSASAATALNAKADKTNRVNGAALSNATSNFYGTSDTAAATVQKEVSIPSITSLDVGTVIIVQPTVTSTVANSTLKLNSFDAYPMLYNNAAITTSTDSIVWNANYPSIFVFDGTYWVFAGHGLDSNTTYTLNYSVDAGQYTAGTGNYAVTRYSILAQKADGTWEKITATNASHSVATSKSVNTNGFILNQLRYYGTTTVVANGALIATNTLYEKSASVDMRYSTNCGATTTWALGDYIYLVGTIGADGLFYLDTTTWWTNALPTTNDGKLYIRLGLVLAAAGYTMSFFEDRPIFYHDGTGIKEYKVADNKQDVISDLATIRSGAALGATAVQPGDLATVATTGDYDDLLNKPTIPAAQVNSDWDAVSGVAQILNKPNLATVATSGDYDDLLNKPTIPTVNDATLTIQKNGTNVATFTANSSSNATANISVPTDTNDLTNGAGYITGITSGDVTTALGYTPYSDANPNGYTSNVGTVTSVNSVSPDGSGNVSLTIPTVNDATITITQGGVTKGSFTLNQASGDTIALDAGGGGSVDIDNLTITKNGSDQLQAVATINANTATGATNPVYDWVGTLAEYTSQAVATNHPDWVCYITDDCEATAYQAYTQSQCNNLFVQKGHQVIDFQAPNAGNNYTWYRKYADGWVEQGGNIPFKTTSLTFPITMDDTNYNIG